MSTEHGALEVAGTRVPAASPLSEEDRPPGRPQQRVYRKIFIDYNGEPPYTCSFCEKDMPELEHVHHLDENPWNNDPPNLAAAHAFCHNSAHHLGWHHAEDTKARVSETIREFNASLTSEERREKYASYSFLGRTHTLETREKIRQGALNRSKIWCDQCQKNWSPCTWNRHIRKYHEGGRW